MLFQLGPQGQGHGCGVQIAFEWAGDGAGKPVQTRRLRALGDGKRRGAQHRSERFVQHGEGGRGPTEVFWVGEGLCGAAGPVLKYLIATRSAKQLQAFPALSDQGDGAVRPEGFPVLQQLRRAAKACEPGVPRRGTPEGGPVDHEDLPLRLQGLQAQGGIHAHDARTDNQGVKVVEPPLDLPIAVSR